MSTIAQLAPAFSASDSDEIPVSQNGIARKVTRGQLLAGLQTELAVPSGSLLGRADLGTGTPEGIAVGANLSLLAGTLSADATPFDISGLAPGIGPAVTDLVPLGQGGGNVALSYADFMAGLGSVSGVSAAGLTTSAAGATAVRSVADFMADAVSAEAFGAAGDGVTDDTAALAAALASGQPVRLGPKVYVVNGQWTVTGAAAVLLGVPGQTVLRRATQTGNGAWISVQSGLFHAAGIIFDANRAGVPQESWGVLVTPSCVHSVFDGCQFTGASGSSLGCGLTIQAADPVAVQHVIRHCEAHDNALHGIWVQAVQGAQVIGCRAHHNGGYGIAVDYTDAHYVQKLALCQVVGCQAWANQRGISVGNYNASNTSPPVWGNNNPDAIAILVADNTCHDNAAYGIAVSGRALAVRGNVLSGNGMGAGGGAGLLANMSYSVVAGNMVTGAAQFGIDAGGSLHSEVSGNYVQGAVHGINPGGSVNMRVSGNTVQECSGWAVLVSNVETDGDGQNFGIACDTVAITDNRICFSLGNGGGGILLLDAPQNVLVARNSFIGLGAATIGQCLWANTDTVTIRDNSWNHQARIICNPSANGTVQQIAFPDILDGLMVTAVSGPVQSLVSLRQQATAGMITFVKVTSGGSGYTGATVAIGGTGSGAAARAVISNGAVIGVVVTSAGGGYGPTGTTIAAVISGDGHGATAVASIGLPIPEERRVRVRANTAVTFARVGSAPFQENWTLFDLTVPANSEVEWTGTWGGWRAGVVALGDYLRFVGDGGLTLRSVNGADIALRPGARGRLRLTSDTEPVGAVSALGRGSPAGVVTAPPGSDYRNLDGGAGKTLWIKQAGTDASGWVAIA